MSFCFLFCGRWFFNVLTFNHRSNIRCIEKNLGKAAEIPLLSFGKAVEKTYFCILKADITAMIERESSVGCH